MQRLKSDSGKTEIVILPPKTSSSDRVIPFPNAILPIIEKHRKPNGNVLLQDNQSIVEPRLLQKKFAKIISACGIEKANFHLLRHTSATLLLYAGVNIKQVQGRLGHGDIETTNKYLHLIEEADVEAVNKLDIMLLPKSDKPDKKSEIS